MTRPSQTEIKKITDNIEDNNIIGSLYRDNQSLQSQIKVQQRMIEELTQQVRH